MSSPLPPLHAVPSRLGANSSRAESRLLLAPRGIVENAAKLPAGRAEPRTEEGGENAAGLEHLCAVAYPPQRPRAIRRIEERDGARAALLAAKAKAEAEFGNGWATRPRPPAMKARYAPREGRAHASTQWGPRHAERASIVETLTNAADHVRSSWACDAERYTSGPCAGLRVVDPAAVAQKVAFCCTDAAIFATSGGAHGEVSLSPARCGMRHICPVDAAAEAGKRARKIVVVAGRTGRPGWLLHVVLTHRDRPPGQETCREAWDRFLAAWERLVSGARGAWWRAMVEGGVTCLETTGGATGKTWHPHMHMMIELPDGVAVETFRDALAAEWSICTALAGASAGVAGWDRSAGRGKDGSEAWCSTVAAPSPLGTPTLPAAEADVRSAAFQTAKYPSPIADLSDPTRIAEFLPWAHGRRMTRWLGRWKDADVQEWIAAAVECDAEDKRVKDIANGDRPDVGRRLPRVRRQGLDAVAEASALSPDGQVAFTVPSSGMRLYRLVSDIRNQQGWSRMAGEQVRMLGILAELATADHVAGLKERFRTLRLRPDIPGALADWDALCTEETLAHWTEDRMNSWYAERDRRKHLTRQGVSDGS